MKNSSPPCKNSEVPSFCTQWDLSNPIRYAYGLKIFILQNVNRYTEVNSDQDNGRNPQSPKYLNAGWTLNNFTEGFSQTHHSSVHKNSQRRSENLE